MTYDYPNSPAKPYPPLPKDPLLEELSAEGHSFFSFRTEDLADSPSASEEHNFSSQTTKGDVDVKNTLYYYAQPCYPTPNARQNFLYLQIVCSALWSRTFHTIRKDLPSYLLAQTFCGSGILEYEGKKYQLEKDDVFLIDCRKEHRIYSAAQPRNGLWGYRFAHFDGTMMPGYFGQIMDSGNVTFHFPRETRFQELFKDLFLLCQKKDANQEIMENLLLTEMMTELLCHIPQYQAPKIPKDIERQQEYIQEHFRENLTLETLSKIFGCSKFHMSREFKKYTGKNMHEYLTECRVAAAQRLLRYSDMPVWEIAEYVGFENQNGFYRAFKQREELSPSLYRKNWKML